jgi:hypothetical protein
MNMSGNCLGCRYADWGRHLEAAGSRQNTAVTARAETGVLEVDSPVLVNIIPSTMIPLLTLADRELGRRPVI